MLGWEGRTLAVRSGAPRYHTQSRERGQMKTDDAAERNGKRPLVSLVTSCKTRRGERGVAMRKTGVSWFDKRRGSERGGSERGKEWEGEGEGEREKEEETASEVGWVVVEVVGSDR